MRLLYYTGATVTLSLLAFCMLFVLYGLGALFSYVINTLVDLLRNGAHLNAWQGVACLMLGGATFHFICRKPS